MNTGDISENAVGSISNIAKVVKAIKEGPSESDSTMLVTVAGFFGITIDADGKANEIYNLFGLD